MRIQGSLKAAADPGALMAAIADMRSILPCLAGVVKVHAVSQDRLMCRIRIKEGMVKGTFEVDARMEAAGNTIILFFKMNGTLGTASGSITAVLSQAGSSTLVEYRGDADIKGLAAAIAGDAVDDAVGKFVRTVMDCLLSGRQASI
ncbi:MAG: SRPBCC domain-containing protein [Candidatus Thermoplasmatota archaeon]|nr:SRPBCC domain-containing protein [Candidatus Thermoplasmatota archaeon]MCL5253176.1 SRPBCC domain-containing protein [Candidatus Thermoplasmatota archaeon]